jgi:hypothetical protein
MTVSALLNSFLEIPRIWSVTALVLMTTAGNCYAFTPQDIGPDTARNGTVSVMVADTHGRPLRSYEIEIIGDPSLRKVLREAGDVQLPYGTYRIRGRASLHHPFERRLVVQSPKLLLLVAFSFRDPGESPVLHTSLIGRVKNVPSGSGRLWVRVLSVFGSFAREAEISQDDTFEIDSVPYGDYLVMVLRDFTVLKVQRFSKTVREEEAIVDLASK